MRLDDVTESQNVEDRRGGMGLGGGGLRLGGGAGCLVLVIVVIVSAITGTNPLRLLSQLGTAEQSGAPAPDAQERVPRADDTEAVFVKKVLATTETTWSELFAKAGRRYEVPTLVLFDGGVASACGMSSAAVGPFYCPGDAKVYLDLSFFRALSRRFGAPGDFAQAYVVAHEVGHHVQMLLGTSDRVEASRERAGSRREANTDSVRLELQADCYAGVWGHHQQALLDPGDVEEGMRAAAAIGDDTIQQQAQGYVAPESWTHGSAEMRVRWLRRGLESGDMASCDTFGGQP